MSAGPDLEQYRSDLRAWLAANLPLRDGEPPRRQPHLDEEEAAAARERQRAVYDAGYAGITVPVAYGGQGLSAAHQRVWDEESAAYVVPMPAGVASVVTAGIIMPTILTHASEEQKREWVPRMLRGDETWVQLLSEPGAGSDLAGLLTRATRDGDAWVINGTKVWSSGALQADYGICLARTDWDAPKHRGLTWFRVPLRHPNVTVRPVRQISGSSEFCEEFLDDVVVGDDCVIGEVNGGWAIANTLLAFERAGGSEAPGSRPEPSRVSRLAPDLVEIAERRGVANDPVIRQLIARAHINDFMQAQLGERVVQTVRTGGNPSAASLMKLGIGVVLPIRGQIGMEVAGRAGVAWPVGSPAAAAATAYLNGRVMAIGGGTNQIQRNIISERLLGLPREVAVDGDKPFRDAKTWGRRPD